MESVASETVDSNLIVNGTSSSQEKAEISATYSWSHSPERDHAAIAIQKYYKGFQARRILAVSKAAAIRIQKHYRGFRTRRNLADSIIAAELLWQTTLSDTQKMGRVPSVDIDRGKHIGSLLKWAETRVEKYGNLSRDQLALLHCLETSIDPLLRYSQYSNFLYRIWDDQCFLGSWKFDSNKISDLKRGESLFTTRKPTSVKLRRDTTLSTQHVISELMQAWETWKEALQRWLEVIDPRHRVGHNLNFYLQIWMTVRSGQPFFYWLDVGDGKTVEHLECSREKLRHERNTYLEPASKSEAVESLMSLMLRSKSDTGKDINNNQQEHDRADGFNQQASKSEAIESPASLMLRRESDTKKDINNNQREHDRANGFDQQASKSEAVESPASLMLRRESDNKKDINNNQREHYQADGFDQQASNLEVVESLMSLVPRSNNQREHHDQTSNSEAVESPASLVPRSNNQREHHHHDQASNSEAVESPASLVPRSNNQREHHHHDQASNSEAVESPASTIIRVEDDKNNNQRPHNGPADGFNLKDLLRRIFYAMNLLLEITTAVLDYVSSQQRQPRYALSGMILSITVMAISLMQLAYTGGKEGVSLQRKSWIPWFYHPAPSNKPFGDPVQVVELFFSVSQCVFAIIAYHYLSRDQNNPAQFCIYPIAFAFCLLCLSFIRREP